MITARRAARYPYAVDAAGAHVTARLQAVGQRAARASHRPLASQAAVAYWHLDETEWKQKVICTNAATIDILLLCRICQWCRLGKE